MKKKLQDMDIQNKKVIVRCDFNVPIKDGIITDDKRIMASLETISYLVAKNCKIILLSHLGRVKKEEDKAKYTLEPVAKYLEKVLNKKIYFSKETRNNELFDRINNLEYGDIILLENTRYEDFPNNLESNNDPQLAMFWAGLADIFVLDAFGSAHRNHASTSGIAENIPSCIGFLMQKEMKELDNLINDIKHPFVILLGGAKVDDKISLIKSLLPKCDKLLLSGGIANSFLKVLKLEIGSSLACNKPTILEEIKEMMLKYKEKLVLPLDAIVGNSYDENYVEYKRITEIDINDKIMDVGIKTLEKYKTFIKDANTIFMNGTLGYCEDNKFCNGTKECLKMLESSNAIKIVGGGDTVSFVNQLGYQKSFTYISTGGGATLEYIAEGKLLALDSISEEEVIETL